MGQQRLSPSERERIIALLEEAGIHGCAQRLDSLEEALTFVPAESRQRVRAKILEAAIPAPGGDVLLAIVPSDRLGSSDQFVVFNLTDDPPRLVLILPASMMTWEEIERLLRAAGAEGR